jgi:phage tail P2-like protein
VAEADISILPPSRTELERALEKLGAERLELIDADILRRLWNPDTCPASHLHILAWAYSVDFWNPRWTDAVKRAVIKAAPRVHRYKGTVQSIEDALEALGVNAQVTEWWQKTPVPGRRGTFSVRAAATQSLIEGEPVLTVALQRAVLAYIRAAKPKSRVFDMALVLGATSRITIGAAMTFGKRLALDAEAIRVPINVPLPPLLSVTFAGVKRLLLRMDTTNA